MRIPFAGVTRSSKHAEPMIQTFQNGRVLIIASFPTLHRASSVATPVPSRLSFPRRDGSTFDKIHIRNNGKRSVTQ